MCDTAEGHKWNFCLKPTKKNLNGLPTEQLQLLDDIIYRGHAMTLAAVCVELRISNWPCNKTLYYLIRQVSVWTFTH